jgi:hypothetical protein
MRGIETAKGEGGRKKLTLSGEGVHDLLLDALLALGESLVLHKPKRTKAHQSAKLQQHRRPN